MAGDDLKSARVHPFARLIAKYPMQMVGAMFLVFFVLSFIGGNAVEVTFGTPSGRNAYSPTDARATQRLDMYIVAQDTIEVKSESAERQTSSIPGFTLIFEEETPSGEPDLSKDIFSPANLEYILRAQEVITKNENYTNYCLRCPTEDSVTCKRATKAYNRALDLETAIQTGEGEAGAVNDALSAAEALCDIVPDTCRIKKCVQDVKQLIADGASNETTIVDTQDCIVLGAKLAKEGACGDLPGCEGASAKKPKCQPAYSPLNYFYDFDKEKFNSRKSSFKKLDNEIDSPKAEDIPDRVSVYPANFFLPRYYKRDDLESHTTRLTVLLGLPLEGYEDANDRTDEQETEVNAWMISVYPELEALRLEIDAAKPGLKLRWLSNNEVINDYFNTILFFDLAAVFGAIIFVGFYIRVHTGSTFLAGMCLLGVILCFPVGCFWTIVVFRVRFFDPLNVFLLFVLLGLGADGVFIVFDAWEQSKAGLDYWTEAHGEDALAVRMSYVWRRASRAMMACNGTTALAFIAVIPSPIMPMASFGILSAFTIIHNWILDVTLVPALILLWDKHLRKNRLCCCLPRPPPSGEPAKLCGLVDDPCAEARTSTSSEVSPARDAKDEGAGGTASHARKGLNRTEKFFRDTYAPLVLKWKVPMLVCSTAFVAVMIYYASLLRADTESPQFLPDNHPLWKAIVGLRDGWKEGESEERGELWMVWGVAGNDASNFTKFDFGQAECNEGPCGEVIWEPSFDPAPVSMQKYLLNSCEEAAKISAPNGRGGDFVYDEKISTCLMKSFRGWLRSKDEDFPVEDEDEFWDKMHEFLREPDEDTVAGEGYGDFVQNKLTRLASNEGKRMFFLIQGVFVDYSPQLFYGTSEVLPGLEASFEFEEEWNEEKPEGQPDFFVTTSSGLFTATRMQEAYISSTFQGVATALGFALFSLLVFVANIVVALLAFVCIAGVVCCTLGIMVLQGWALGPIEAICATIVVGFSVDYVVHYALAYVAAPDKKRAERVTFALSEVGISVMAGAITTLGASAFLLVTTLSFFSKFGIFMMSTIAFSLVVANVAFVALLALCGPENDVGDMRIWAKWIMDKAKGRSSDGVDAV